LHTTSSLVIFLFCAQQQSTLGIIVPHYILKTLFSKLLTSVWQTSNEQKTVNKFTVGGSSSTNKTFPGQ
jgi:hypothetical protein